jgi:hypothetical protein
MAKKDKASKLPKKVGGVKVPKQLRKTAKAAIEIAQNPIAREIVSAAVVAGVAALSKSKVQKAAESPAATAVANKVSEKASDLGSLISQGVAAFVSGFDKGAGIVSDNLPPKAKPGSGTKPKA